MSILSSVWVNRSFRLDNRKGAPVDSNCVLNTPRPMHTIAHHYTTNTRAQYTSTETHNDKYTNTQVQIQRDQCTGLYTTPQIHLLNTQIHKYMCSVQQDQYIPLHHKYMPIQCIPTQLKKYGTVLSNAY